MSVFSLNSSHIGSLPPNQQHAWARKPSDQRSKTSQNSKTSNQSTGTVQHNADRKVSASSAGSRNSKGTAGLRVMNENIAPSRSVSYTSMLQPQNVQNGEKAARPKLHLDIPRHNMIHGHNHATPAPGLESSMVVNDGTLEEIDLNSSNDALSYQSTLAGVTELASDDSPFSRKRTERRKSTWVDRPLSASQVTSPSDPPTSGTETGTRYFKKLVDGLRWQSTKPKPHLSERKERWSLDDFDSTSAKDSALAGSRPVWHRKASSWASGGIVTPAKPANVTSSQVSARQPDRGSKFRFFGRSNRNSRASDVADDSVNELARIAQDELSKRAVQRRNILEEILASEEGYINDLKVLAHVYLTILGSLPQFPRFMQGEVERNLNEILVLHEEILIHMKLFIPEPFTKVFPSTSHRRSDSVDSNSKGQQDKDDKENKRDSRKSLRSAESVWFRHSKTRITTATPKEAIDIAKIFGNMMSRFFVYEEYGARYETMLQLVASTSKTIPNWWAFERGIEALMNSLLPKQQSEEQKKKGLTLEDLLIKPIQRVCRYPLLLAELLKNTPELDDKEGAKVIGTVLNRFRETTREINKATNDPEARARIQRSWLLQDILHFPEGLSSSTPRALGHPRLCGLLYVAYRSTDGPQGDYMLCTLFNSHLLLAVPDPNRRQLKVVAVLETASFQIERPDDGRGLQCHNALYCWKLIFSFEQHLYEFILCACSSREEEGWKAELLRSAKAETTQAASDSTFLALNMKDIAFVVGQPGSLGWRMSMQRAATVDRRSSASQVIIHNTHSVREGQDSPKITPPNFRRSNSLQSGCRIPVLAPDRSDRARLEHALENVWTKDQLPFPGMASNRGANFIRASKHTVIRKLSRASSTTQSSKRSFSNNSLLDDPFIETDSERARRNTNTSDAGTPQSAHPYVEWDSLPDVSEEDGPYNDAAKKVTFQSIRTRSRGTSDATIVAEEEDGKGGGGANKIRKPKMLLKAFSTDGIKTWFA